MRLPFIAMLCYFFGLFSCNSADPLPLNIEVILHTDSTYTLAITERLEHIKKQELLSTLFNIANSKQGQESQTHAIDLFNAYSNMKYQDALYLTAVAQLDGEYRATGSINETIKIQRGQLEKGRITQLFNGGFAIQGWKDQDITVQGEKGVFQGFYQGKPFSLKKI